MGGRGEYYYVMSTCEWSQDNFLFISEEVEEEDESWEKEDETSREPNKEQAIEWDVEEAAAAKNNLVVVSIHPDRPTTNPRCVQQYGLDANSEKIESCPHSSFSSPSSSSQNKFHSLGRNKAKTWKLLCKESKWKRWRWWGWYLTICLIQPAEAANT